jgi:hypothetical protein
MTSQMNWYGDHYCSKAAGKDSIVAKSHLVTNGMDSNQTFTLVVIDACLEHTRPKSCGNSSSAQVEINY